MIRVKHEINHITLLLKNFSTHSPCKRQNPVSACEALQSSQPPLHPGLGRSSLPGLFPAPACARPHHWAPASSVPLPDVLIGMLPTLFQIVNCLTQDSQLSLSRTPQFQIFSPSLGPEGKPSEGGEFCLFTPVPPAPRTVSGR